MALDIQYVGQAGITQECLESLARLIQCRVGISSAQILTCNQNGTTQHGLLLTVQEGEYIAVKSGFTSGYCGEGPRGLSRALSLLEAHQVAIEEYSVDKTLIERLNFCALTKKDLQTLDRMHPLRPCQWRDYIFEQDWERARDGTLWKSLFNPVMPFAIIDPRIMDLAKTFWNGPDERLLTGYRRLEDIVRDRVGIRDHGQGLFSTAFRGNTPKLVWKDCDKGEQEGRASLFVGAYMAFRNPRAHREQESFGTTTLNEFLILNHLFLMEQDAVHA